MTEWFLIEISNFLPMGVLVIKIVLRYSANILRMIKDLSITSLNTSASKPPSVKSLKHLILVIIKHSEGSYVAPLIYSATWHFARKISFARGLFPHDSHVICDVTLSNFSYHWKVTTISKFG